MEPAPGFPTLSDVRDVLHFKRCRYVDAVLDSPVDWAAVVVNVVSATRRIVLVRRQAQVIGYMDAPNDEHAILFLDLTDRFGAQPAFTGRYPARFQRATEGAGQSTSGR